VPGEHGTDFSQMALNFVFEELKLVGVGVDSERAYAIQGPPHYGACAPPLERAGERMERTSCGWRTIVLDSDTGERGIELASRLLDLHAFSKRQAIERVL
jgi:hypothetical protein